MNIKLSLTILFCSLAFSSISLANHDHQIDSFSSHLARYDEDEDLQQEEDSSIRVLNRIQELLHDTYKDYNINVHFDGQTVTLKGTVNSAHDKERIERTVKEIQGVRSVNNFLQVTEKKN